MCLQVADWIELRYRSISINWLTEASNKRILRHLKTQPLLFLTVERDEWMAQSVIGNKPQKSNPAGEYISTGYGTNQYVTCRLDLRCRNPGDESSFGMMGPPPKQSCVEAASKKPRNK
jgi:hypothetical protein